MQPCTYGDAVMLNNDLGKHWLRQWLSAWWHQAITLTNVDFLWIRSQVQALSHETKFCNCRGKSNSMNTMIWSVYVSHWTCDANFPYFRPFFTATVFAKLLQNDPYGRISIMQFFNYVMRKVWLHQTRIGLSLYDVAGQGYLKESVSMLAPVNNAY